MQITWEREHAVYLDGGFKSVKRCRAPEEKLLRSMLPLKEARRAACAPAPAPYSEALGILTPTPQSSRVGGVPWWLGHASSLLEPLLWLLLHP